MQNNIKIAITGGIGSGKSTVANLIKEQGYTVYSCDEIYKQLLQNSDFLNTLVSAFGKIIIKDGKLDRKKLSEIVFNDSEKLKRLNNITHPAIMNEVMRLMEGEGVYFCEVPLLFEEGLDKLFDNIIVVLREKKERVKAVAERDGVDMNCVLSRINAQFDYDKAEFAKYYIIHNNSDLINLHRQIIEILNQINN